MVATRQARLVKEVGDEHQQTFLFATKQRRRVKVVETGQSAINVPEHTSPIEMREERLVGVLRLAATLGVNWNA